MRKERAYRMILTICPNTALDKILFIKEWTPGIPMRTNNTIDCVGGKGLDSSVVLSQLGVETVGMGFFSGKTGEELIEILKEYGIVPVPIWVGGTNRIAYVIAEESTNIHSHVIVGHVEVSKAQKQEFIDEFSVQIKNAQWVIFAGSIPPSVNADFYRELIGIAHNENVPSLIDAQNAYIAEAIDVQPDIVKMNWEEFEWTFGFKAEDIKSLYLQAKEFKRDRKIKNLILTLSKDGILALTEQGDYLAKAPLQKPVNAAGAGDAVSSTIVWRLSLGDDWMEALRWASAVSAAAVLTKRTGDINMEDVHRIYKDVEIRKIG